MSKKFRIVYQIDVTLSKKEIWPDKDGPKNPTAEDVTKVIEACGGFPKIIDTWNLDDGFRPNFTVTEEE